ncbi:hypothetical protein FGO68_gene16590 [Halteria grandinella]|uniref:Uncharacterized protein n=1 Tax=Halteria grandinella TaxID=5974 RepID=A0A8J8T1Q3_HALGN|nr:hypothetical protein FGO68_gene16590 [Halteria grandinella]
MDNRKDLIFFSVILRGISFSIYLIFFSIWSFRSLRRGVEIKIPLANFAFLLVMLVNAITGVLEIEDIDSFNQYWYLRSIDNFCNRVVNVIIALFVVQLLLPLVPKLDQQRRSIDQIQKGLKRIRILQKIFFPLYTVTSLVLVIQRAFDYYDEAQMCKNPKETLQSESKRSSVPSNFFWT